MNGHETRKMDFLNGMEEKLLAEHFGDEYEAYRQTTKRLIPFLY